MNAEAITTEVMKVISKWCAQGSDEEKIRYAILRSTDSIISGLTSPDARVWDCRVCGFGVREGAALDWIRDHGEHYNARSEKVPNGGTAYCPTCSDETLRHP